MKELSELLGLRNRKEAKREEQIARERAEKTRRLLEDAERIIDTLGDTPTISDGEFYTRTTQVAQTDTPTYNSTGTQEYVLQELLWYDKKAQEYVPQQIDIVQLTFKKARFGQRELINRSSVYQLSEDGFTRGSDEPFEDRDFTAISSILRAFEQMMRKKRY